MAFIELTEQEFDDFLLPLNYNRITLSFTREKVYEKELGDGIAIRIFSTIQDAISRGVGKDAIRTCLIDKIKDKGLGKTTRTNRTGDSSEDVFNRVRQKLAILEEQARRHIGAHRIVGSVQKVGVNGVRTDISKLIKYPFELNPVQRDAIEKGLLDGKNMLISSPTASGKTVIAELAIMKCIRDYRIACYISPMKSLCEEKMSDWKELFKDFKLCVLTGDYVLSDEKQRELEDADIIIATNEMLDSRLTKQKTEKQRFLKAIGVLVIDETHLISSGGRGDKLENSIILFCKLNPKVQLIFLSATLSDLDKLKLWVEKLTGREMIVIESDYRPCKLNINYEPFDDSLGAWNWDNRMAEVQRLVLQDPGDKFLIFCPSRKDSVRTAKRLKDIGFKAEYHNASLDLEDRRDREKRFKNGDLQIIASTPTLALGVNLPAKRVIIEGSYRGIHPISSLEVNQCCGRGGRPKYDVEGYATVLVPFSEQETEIVRLNNIKIDSVLGNTRDLSFHLTKLVYLGIITTNEEADAWWKDTFAYQLYGYVTDIKHILERLVKWEILEKVGDKYIVTHLGRISSLLYFYPDDIVAWKKGFEEVVNKDLWNNDVQVCKSLVCPTLTENGYVTRDEKGEVMDFYHEKGYPTPLWSDEDLVRVKYTMYYYYCLNQYQMTDKKLENKKGFINILRVDSERVTQALGMLNGFLKWGVGDRISTLIMRLRYGVPPDAAELVSIRGIGTKRGLALYNEGIKTKGDILRNKGKVTDVLGKRVAMEIFQRFEHYREPKAFI